MLCIQLINHSLNPRCISTRLITVGLEVFVIIHVINGIGMHLSLPCSAVVVYSKCG
ncbi:hypothetical protein D3C78_1704020 [compost metagenome]